MGNTDRVFFSCGGSISTEEYDSLPEGVKSELRVITRGRKSLLEKIIELLSTEGPMSKDGLLVAAYKKYNEVWRRATITSNISTLKARRKIEVKENGLIKLTNEPERGE